MDEGKDEAKGERPNNTSNRSARARSPARLETGPRIPSLRRAGARQFLHDPAQTQYIDLTEDAPEDSRPNHPPAMYLDGARYILKETATANDQPDAWAREDDMTATCKKLDGDRKRQRLDPIQEESEAESAVDEAKRHLLIMSKEYIQQLEKEARLAAKPQGRYRSLSGSFRGTPVAGEEEMLATAMAMSLAAEKEECKHLGVDGLRMLNLEEREKSVLKWPIGYSATCGICEEEIEVGDPYKRCRICLAIRCRRCEWTLKHGGRD